MSTLSLAEKRRYSNLISSMGFQLKIGQTSGNIQQNCPRYEVHQEKQEELTKENIDTPQTLENKGMNVFAQINIQNAQQNASIQNKQDSKKIENQYSQILFNEHIEPTAQNLVENDGVKEYVAQSQSNCYNQVLTNPQIENNEVQKPQIEHCQFRIQEQKEQGQHWQSQNAYQRPQEDCVQPFENTKMQIEYNYQPCYNYYNQPQNSYPKDIQIDGPNENQQFSNQNNSIEEGQMENQGPFIDYQNFRLSQEINLETIRQIYSPISERHMIPDIDIDAPNNLVLVQKQPSQKLSQIKQLANQIQHAQDSQQEYQNGNNAVGGQQNNRQIQIFSRQNQFLQNDHGSYSQIQRNQQRLENTQQVGASIQINQTLKSKKFQQQPLNQQFQVQQEPIFYQEHIHQEQNHQEHIHQEQNHQENIHQEQNHQEQMQQINQEQFFQRQMQRIIHGQQQQIQWEQHFQEKMQTINQEQEQMQQINQKDIYQGHIQEAKREYFDTNLQEFDKQEFKNPFAICQISQQNSSNPLPKIESQKNEQNSKRNPRPKKSSFSQAVRNVEADQVQNFDNKRKLSESYKSSGIGSFTNRISSQMKAGKKADSQQFPSNSGNRANFLQSRESILKNQDDSRIMQVEENIEPSNNVIKLTPNNFFSNRSQKSLGSNKSNQSKNSNSGYRYNRFIDTMQVPQLSTLEVVPSNDGKELRVQRKSSRSSHHSRSASTCKKSYEDLSDIHMQQIPQSVCEEFQDKSIKRSTHHNLAKGFHLQDYEIQKVDEFSGQNDLDSNQFLIEQNHRVHYQQDIDIDLCQTYQQPENSAIKSNSPLKSHSPLKSNSQKIPVKIPSNNYKVPQSNSLPSQINIHQPQNRQLLSQQFSYNFYRQTIAQDDKKEKNQESDLQNFVQEVSKSPKMPSSKKKRLQCQRVRQQEQRQEERKALQMQNKISRLSHHRQIIQIRLQNDTEEQVIAITRFCQDFLNRTHQLSIFERTQFKNFVQCHFQVYGFQLEPRNRIGLIILHDGIFACSYIKYMKGSRNNSGMIQSMMYNQFEEETNIKTNKEYFSKQLKRVKEQRQMHYKNEFAKRLQQFQEQKRVQQYHEVQILKNRRNQLNLNLSPQKDHQLQSRVISHHYSTSNVSVANSSDTVTVDGQKQTLQEPIRRSQLAQVCPWLNSSQIAQASQEYEKNIWQIENNTSSIVDRNNLHPQQVPQKQEKKKKVTKRKEKPKQHKVQEPDVQKKQKDEESVQNLQQTTISQTTQVNNQKNISKEKKQKSKSDEQKKQKNRLIKGILKQSKVIKEESSSEEIVKQKKQRRSKALKPSNQEKSRTKKGNQSNRNSLETKQNSSSKKQSSSERKISMNKRTLTASIKKPQKSSAERQKVQNVSSSKEKNSLQKIAIQKVKAVKFTNSTKGGTQSYDKRKNQKMEGVFQQSQVGQKRRLRSRSKK